MKEKAKNQLVVVQVFFYDKNFVMAFMMFGSEMNSRRRQRARKAEKVLRRPGQRDNYRNYILCQQAADLWIPRGMKPQLVFVM